MAVQSVKIIDQAYYIEKKINGHNKKVKKKNLATGIAPAVEARLLSAPSRRDLPALRGGHKRSTAYED